MTAREEHGAEAVISTVPPHSAYVLARMARSCAQDYLAFADRVEGREAAQHDGMP
jgi:hypothetical protein